MKHVLRGLGWKLILLNLCTVIFLISLEVCEYITAIRLDFIFLPILNNISYGIVASTIFYIIVIIIPQERKRSHISRFLSNKISAINTRLNLLLTHIYENSTEKFEFNPQRPELASKDKMKVICKSVDINKVKSRTSVFQGGWLNYLENISKNTKNDIHDLFQFSDILDPKLVGLLSEIEDIANNRLSYEMQIGNSDIELFTSPIREIVILSREASGVYRENYHHHLKEHSARYRIREK